MHKLKQSLVGLRLLPLQWSDSVGRFVMISCVAAIFFLLGLAAGLLQSDDRASLAVHKVHTERVTVIPEKAGPPQTPIVPRIINANPVPTTPASAEHGPTDASDRVDAAPSTAATNPSGLADVPQSTPTGRSATETRESVQCLTPKARALLDAIETQFGRVMVISTCRPGATIAGSGNPSKHRNGNAIDFVAPTGSKAAVVAWLTKNHTAGGVMTYSDSDHIHVDIGHHFVSLAGERQRKRRARDDDD